MNPTDDFATFAQKYNGPMVSMNTQPLATPAQNALPAKPHDDGGVLGFLERNAQTIGGVAGGVLGEIVDPFGGGVIGSAIGSGLGQAAKNATTGTTTNPLEEALIGGASDLGGALLGKVAKPVMSKVANVADRFGVNLLSQVGGTVDRRTARALDAAGTTRFMSDLGVDPRNWDTTARGVFDVLTPLVNKGVSKASKVDTAGLEDMVDGLINKSDGITGMAHEKGTEGYKLSQSLKSTLGKLRGTESTTSAPITKMTSPADVLALNANPSDTLDAIKTLRRESAELTGKGRNPLTVTGADRAKATIRNQLADELEERLYEGAGANKVVTSGLVDKSAIDALSKVLPDTPMAHQYIQSIANAQSIRELRSAQAPFVNASQLAAEKAAEMGSAGATNRSLGRQIVGTTAGLGGVVAAPFTGGLSAVVPAAEIALGTDTGKTVIGNTLRKTASKITSGAEKPSDILNKLPGIVAAKTVEQGLPRAATGSGSVQHTVTDAINSAMMSNPQMAMMAQTGGATASSPALPNFQQLTQSMGLRGAEDYMNYVKMTQPELNQDQQTNWVQGQTLLSRLQQVAQLYSEAGAGPVKGRLSELSGAFGTSSGKAAQTYDAQRDELANTLVRFINEGGRSGGTQLTTMLRKELPTLGDSPAVASQKFNTIVQAVVMQMQNNLAAPATNTPGMLTSFAGQQPGGGSAGNFNTAAGNILTYLPPNMGLPG